MTASWSPTKVVVVICVVPHQGHVLSDAPTATVETGGLQLQVRNCGTAFQLIYDKLTLAFNDLNGYQRHFCSGAEIATHYDQVLKLRLIINQSINIFRVA